MSRSRPRVAFKKKEVSTDPKPSLKEDPSISFRRETRAKIMLFLVGLGISQMADVKNADYICFRRLLDDYERACNDALKGELTRLRLAQEAKNRQCERLAHLVNALKKDGLRSA